MCFALLENVIHLQVKLPILFSTLEEIEREKFTASSMTINTGKKNKIIYNIMVFNDWLFHLFSQHFLKAQLDFIFTI